MRRYNPDSFDLYGDGDDVDVIKEAEQVFGIRITDEEAERMRTFGDFLDCVEGKMDLTGPRTCLLRRAFLDLRDAVPETDGLRLRPSLPVVALGDGDAGPRHSVIRWVQGHIEQRSSGWMPVIGLAAMFGIPLLLAAWQAGGVAGLGILLILIAGFLIVTWRAQPPSPATVGALRRANFHHLYPELARRHGPGLACDRWSALEAICRDVSGFVGPVNRDTTFFSHLFPEGAR